MNHLGDLKVLVQRSPAMAFIYFNAPFYVWFFRFFFSFVLFCSTPVHLTCVPVFRHCYFSCQVWQYNRVLLTDLQSKCRDRKRFDDFEGGCGRQKVW